MNIRLTHKEMVAITWKSIREAAEGGKLDKLLCSGDTLNFLLRDGAEAELYIDSVRPHNFTSVLVRGVVDREMYECETYGELMRRRPANWAESDARYFLNSTVATLLPQELQEMLIPYEIIQTVKGVERVTHDKLWLPSETQAYGAPVYSGETDGGEEDRMMLFKSGDWKKYAVHAWLRSVHASISYSFCVVSTDGTATNDSAYRSHGCAPALVAGSTAEGGDRNKSASGSELMQT